MPRKLVTSVHGGVPVTAVNSRDNLFRADSEFAQILIDRLTSGLPGHEELTADGHFERN